MLLLKIITVQLSKLTAFSPIFTPHQLHGHMHLFVHCTQRNKDENMFICLIASIFNNVFNTFLRNETIRR